MQSRIDDVKMDFRSGHRRGKWGPMKVLQYVGGWADENEFVTKKFAVGIINLPGFRRQHVADGVDPEGGTGGAAKSNAYRLKLCRNTAQLAKLVQSASVQ